MVTKEKKTILVTGANGFVGKFMVRALFERGYRVKCFVLKETDIDALSGLPIDIAYGDVRDPKSIEKAVEGTNAVVHLVAAVGIPQREVNFSINVEGTQNLIDACRKRDVSRIIFFSSISAKRKEASVYGQTKREAENRLLASGLNVTIYRPEMIYGNGSRGLRKIMRHVQLFPAVIPLVGKGEILRQPVYVRDVVHLTAKTLENEAAFGKKYDLVGKDRVTLRTFITLVSEELGLKKVFVPIPVKPSLMLARLLEKVYDSPPFTLDNMIGLTLSSDVDDTIFEELDFHPYSLKEGLRKAIKEIQLGVV
jgi:nucleoside-diphosphate-sugar epimerase